MYFTQYYLCGADNPDGAAIYNKTYAYMDDLVSLLYSPVSLKFNIGDPGLPNLAEINKNRAAATKLRQLARQSETDTLMSQAVEWSLVKGKALTKTTFKRNRFACDLVQPESFGVFRENYGCLDEDMEAFVHTQFITPYQFDRMIAGHPKEEPLRRRAKTYIRTGRGDAGPDEGALRQVIVGGFYPFTPASSPQRQSGSPNLVDWMGAPNPEMAQSERQSLLQLDELWVWDDDNDDWATFQLIGDDMLIWPIYQTVNLLAYNPESHCTVKELQGVHPFREFCPTPLDGYFWGRSEIVNIAMLQECISARINGVNRMLRKEEDPSHKFVGVSGVNQNALARFKKPGGYWVDTNPNAKIEQEAQAIPPDVWAALHEYERMFDEMGGLPPIAKGHGEAGVRSQGHAETLVRMFSPRFKDRALLCERSVEGVGALMLDLARVHVAKKMFAWVPQAAAGGQALPPNELIPPPAAGLACIPFSFASLEDEVSLTVDSHSSSPAFMQEAKALIFDLLKIGAADPIDVINHTDAPNPEALIAGVERRAAEKAQQLRELEQKGEEKEALKLIQGGGRKK